MSKALSRTLLVLAASVVAAALAVWVARSRRQHKDLDFVRAPGASTPRPANVPTATPHVAPGASALDANLPVFPPSTFRRFALTPDEVGRWFGQRDIRLEYDAYTYVKYKGGIDHEFDWEEIPRGKWRLRTNSRGFREDEELLPGHPDLRILVTGDSHTDGVCDNADSFPNQLEALLRGGRPDRSIEVLNAGRSSTSFYNYLGALERDLALEPDVLIVAVYGGNDFEEALTLFHLFHGTERPPGMELYRAQIEAAFEIHRPCVGQEFNQLKYFATHRDQIDVALQMARDVSTEIVVTCARFGVHPIFVYIPPFDVDTTFEEHRATMDQVAQKLGLSADDRQISLRIADSFVAFLRGLRTDVLDLREVYRGKTERLYWMRDHHTDIAANKLIAEALLPFVDAAVPSGAQRVRTAPGTHARTDARSRFEMLSPGAPDPDGPTIGLHELPHDPLEPPWKLALAGAFAVPALDERRVRELFTLRDVQEFEPRTWFRYRAGLANGDLRTNSLGLRMEAEVAPERPRWRVALLGDEQVIGTGAANETIASVLAEHFAKSDPSRRVECLDFACEGFGLHNHLGALECARELGIDHVVLCVDGGNDFDEALRIERALGRDKGDESRSSGAVEKAQALDTAAARAFLAALARFGAQPSDARDATRIALDITHEFVRHCRAANLEFTLVFLPAPHETEREALGERLKGWAGALELDDKALRTTNRVAANYLSYLRGESHEVIDLTNPFQEIAGSEFDLATLRLNAAGEKLVAQFIALAIEHRPQWFLADR